MLDSRLKAISRTLLAAALLNAFAVPGLHAADAEIGPDAWRALTEGKTLFYYRDGALYGWEYYYPDSVKVEFCSADGVHAVGEWGYSEGTYCFAYFGDLHCFRHVMRDGEIFVIDVNSGDDGAGGDEQRVDRIANGGPIPCSEGSRV